MAAVTIRNLSDEALRSLEARAARHNRSAEAEMRAILEAAGLTLDNVVKATVFIKNMNDFAAINEVYASYFQKPYPARSCVEVARLPRDVLVEIEVVASR